ncbi:MAG: amidase [Acidobacteria bacterium]|nr:MAG: amidase [Acidobacteriota bacterium]
MSIDTPHGVDRRRFLTLGALTAGAAAASSALPEAALPPTPRGEAVPAFELEELGVADLQRRMESGQDSARSLLEKYLARIEALDKQGPTLRQVLELNPDAMQIAEALDAERKAGRVRGPMHGIPVLIKDNVGTADRMTTTAGSLALEGSIPPKDSFVARRLRESGAVILGKTNLSEWANFRSTHSSSGWSGRGNQGRNPYALDRNTSGSSSGTGAAIAASYAAVGIGTETDGSVVSPANNCALVGFKPTVGLVSRAGIIPIAHSQDTAGPMTRTVQDAAILLGVLAGPDPDDRVTRDAARRGQADYRKFLDPAGLKGARVGVPRKAMFDQSVHADRMAEAAIEVLTSLGAIIVDPVGLTPASKVSDPEFEVLLYEFKADLNAYLAGLGPKAPARSLKDLIAFNERHADREMPYFGQEIFLMAQKKGPLTDAKYRKALADCRRLSRTLGIDATMAKHRLDALIAPTSGPPTLTDLANGDYGPGGSSTLPAVAGYPHITVPAGFVFGLPVGLSFFGRPFSEPTLLRLAYAFEQATKHRKPPRFLPTAELA